MIDIPMRSSGCLDSSNILSINQARTRGALSRQDLSSINLMPPRRSPDAHPASGGRQPYMSQPAAPVSAANTSPPVMPHTSEVTPPPPGTTYRQVPALRNLIQKGQKVNIGIAGQLQKVRIAMGWNTTNPQCDIDLSAYLLDSSGKVPADDWFVFYGQPGSPDNSVILNVNGSACDREIADIDLTRINPSIKKIVFVLTINEAFTYNLNFSMVKDAYIRLLDPSADREIYSFMLTDYYANVTSMMLGEIYLHNNTWKFNAIGNGVARDLAGLCELYGVQTN